MKEPSIKLKVKKLLKEAILPKYATAGAACADLFAASITREGDNIVYDTGLAFEIPEGYVGLVFPRSSISKKNLFLRNHVGVIDSDYRGSVLFKFGLIDKRTCSKQSFLEEEFLKANCEENYKIGERIGQIMILPLPKIKFEEVDNLEETKRGTGGYGSTGR